MGEIKSTLDLVMEKTKNLTLSSAEKAEQRQREIETRVKAMLQKHLDGMLSANELQTEYETLWKDFSLADHKILASEILSRLDPDQDNHPLLELLEKCCHLNATAIEAVIDDYRAIYRTAVQKRMEELREHLARTRRISGSAVVPILEADGPWRQKAGVMRSEFENKISREKADLLGGG